MEIKDFNDNFEIYDYIKSRTKEIDFFDSDSREVVFSDNTVLGPIPEDFFELFIFGINVDPLQVNNKISYDEWFIAKKEQMKLDPKEIEQEVTRQAEAAKTDANLFMLEAQQSGLIRDIKDDLMMKYLLKIFQLCSIPLK